MSNVQAGDLAKIIRSYENVGAQVLVLEAYTSPFYRSYDDSPLWMVEALQPVWVLNALNARRLAPPGTKFLEADSCLKRIDPPEQDEQLFRDQPTDEELAEELNHRIKETL